MLQMKEAEFPEDTDEGNNDEMRIHIKVDIINGLLWILDIVCKVAVETWRLQRGTFNHVLKVHVPNLLYFQWVFCSGILTRLILYTYTNFDILAKSKHILLGQD